MDNQIDNNQINTVTTDQPVVEVPIAEGKNTPTETVGEENTPTETVGEVVNMPDAPVTENSEPKVIEVQPEPIVEEILAESTPAVSETLPEVPPAPETATEPVLTEEPVPVETTESTSPASPEPEIYTARSNETGDKVYAIKDKKRYWIKNPETLAKMGFYLGKEKRIPFSELLGYPEGKPIDLTIPGAVYPWDEPEQPAPEPTNSTNIWQ